MKYYLAIICFLFSITAGAANQGWTGYSKVVALVNTAQGGINVRLSPELTGCVSQSGYGDKYASVYPTHVGIDKIQATLLAAYMADKEVRLYFSDDKCKVLEVILGGQ